MCPDPNDRPQAYFDALDAALQARESGEFDAESFRDGHPEYGDEIIAELDVLDRLENPGAMAVGGLFGPGGGSPADHTVDLTPGDLTAGDLTAGATRGSDALAASAMPARLGDFELTGEIGRGGMGVVYAAKQVGLDRDVAVKLLPPGFAADQRLRRRFEREAELAARLVHPGIVRIYAFGEASEILYLAMERIDGASLQAALADLPERTAEGLARAVGADAPEIGGIRGYIDQIADIGATVADALHDAHGHGLVHRDVKPGNILLDRKLAPHLADFGLARAMDSQSLTASGHVLGTPSYLAPECIRGEPASGQTDVFALGATLYEALSGTRVFDGQTTAEILNRVLNTDPPSLDRRDKRIPADLANVIQRSLEKEPKRRYADAAAFRDDLVRFRRGEPVSAVRVNAIGRAVRRARRRPLTTVTIVLVTLLLTTMATVWIASSINRANERTRRHAALLTRAAKLERDNELQAALALYREAAAIRSDDPRTSDGIERIGTRIANERIARDRNILMGDIITADNAITQTTVEDLNRWEKESGEARLVAILRAFIAFNRNDDQAALDYLDRAAAHGTSLCIHYMRSYALTNLERNEEAREARRRADSSRPERVEDYMIAAGRMHQEGDREASFDLLRRGQIRFPDEPVLIQVHAWLLYRSWRQSEALPKFEQALLSEPDLTSARVAKARCLLDLRRFDEAEAEFRRTLDQRPDLAEARVGLAETLFYAPSKEQKKNRERAFEIVEEGLAEGDDAALYNIRGWFRAMVGKYPAAEADYRKAIALARNHLANVNLGIFLRRSGRLDEYHKHVEACLRRSGFPNRFKISLLNDRAIGYWQSDQEKAERSLRDALGINRTPNIVANLALLCIQQQRYVEAIPLLTEQIAAGFNAAKALCRRGYCRYRRLDWRLAERDQQMGIERASETPSGRVENWMLLNRSAIDAARGSFREAHERIASDKLLDAMRAHMQYVDWRFRAEGGDGVRAAIERVVKSKRINPAARDFLDAWRLGLDGNFTGARDKLPDALETGKWHCPDPIVAVAVRWGATGDNRVKDAARRVLRNEAVDAAALPPFDDAASEAGRQWLIGRALLRRGRADDARAPLERAATGLAYGHCAFDYAVALLRSGDEAGGIEQLDEAVRRGRSRTEITWWLGAHRVKPTDALRTWFASKAR